MQQTETYKLNKPEMSDLMSLAPLNENMDKVEGALTALTARTVTLENCRIVLGRYYGAASADGSIGQVIDLGERPLAVFICSSASDATVSYSGFIVLDGKSSGKGTNATAMELRDNGFWVNNVLNFGSEYRFVAFLGDWPTILRGKNDIQE